LLLLLLWPHTLLRSRMLKGRLTAFSWVSLAAVVVAFFCAAAFEMGSGFSVIGTTRWYLHGEKHFGLQGFLEAAKTFSPGDLDVDLRGQTAVVTGANAGLGFETARALAARNATVHVLCRNKEKGEAAIKSIEATKGPFGSVKLHLVDVSSKAAVVAFANEWLAKGEPINSLVLNAGVLPQEKTLSVDGMEVGFATAMLQSYLLTGLLMPALSKASPAPGRAIHVSSGGQYTVSWDSTDPLCEKRKFDGRMQYAISKKAQVMLSEMWASRAPKGSVVSNCMHPGWADTPGVQTSISDFAESHKGKLRSLEQGADTIVWLAATKNPLATTSNGLFFFDRKPVETDFSFSGTRASPAQFEKLWRDCERWTGYRWDEEKGRMVEVSSSAAAGAGGAGGMR
jgi:dehydrogenase/reductase SDR family member 12